MDRYAEEKAEATALAAEYLSTSGPLREALDVPAGFALEPHLLGMGEHNLNFRFALPGGQHAVLRVNVASQPFHKNQIRYEFGALEAAVPSGCTPQPLFVDDSPAAPGKGVLVESFCEGRQLDFDDLRPGDVRCAIQMMADVHAVPVSDSCGLFCPADPLRAMFEECQQRFRDHLASGFQEERLTRWMEAFMRAAERMLAEAAPPQDRAHIVNTETLPSHFLIPESAAARAVLAGRAGRLVDAPGHFVDWERPVLGEVAQDVAYFVSPTTTFWDSEFLFPARDIPGVIDAYWQAVDGRFGRTDFDERFRAWRMMTALKSTSWCLQALARYRGEQAAHTTEKTAGKLPVYLSEEFMELIAAECFCL